MLRLRKRWSHAAVAIATTVVAVSLAGAGAHETSASSPGDLIDLVQVGTGSGGLVSAATAAFIQPLRWDGTTAAKGALITLPTVDAGPQHAVTESGSASSESLLELSQDENYLTLGGYDAALGTPSVNSTTSVAAPRVIARIDGAGTVNTTTALTDAFSTSNFRGVVTDNGTHFWAAGDGGSVTSGSDKNAGVVYVSALGATTSTGLETSPKQTRAPVIAGGNLYFSTSKSPGPGVFQLGSGLPTSTAAVTALNTEVDPYSFVLLHTASTGTALDTAYVADGTNGGIFKYSLSGSTWAAKGNVSAGTNVGLEGLTGRVESGGVQLYATTLDGGTGGNSVLALTDASGFGNTITGSLTTIATAPTNTAFKGVAFAPTGQVITLGPPTITLADSALSRSIGDSYAPNQTTATIVDSTYQPSQLTVTATSDNAAVVPSVSVSGTGSTRTLTVTSNATVGLADITVTVSTPDGRSASAVLQYGVSAAAPDATSSFLYDFANASTAIDVGGGYYVVGDDEFNQIALYKAGVSGPPVKTWNFDSLMGVNDTSQIDIEAAAIRNGTIYWFGSEGNSSSNPFDVKLNRSILFATSVTGAGPSTDLGFAGYYRNMRSDLLAWDAANGNQFGFATGSAGGQTPKEVNGFNIEGAEFAAGGSGTLYLGFRAPIVPTSNRTQALVVPVTNLASLISSSGASGTATFGTALQWNLTPPGYANGNGDASALGIRDIRKNADDQYLIIAGSYEGVPAAPSGGAEFLYSWDGNPAHQPVLTNTVVPTPDDGSWETIVSVPDPLTDGSAVPVIQDDGDNDLYNNGVEAKDLSVSESPLMKDRADVITLSLPSQTVAFTSAAPSPGYRGTTYAMAATGGGSSNPVVFSIDSSSTSGACSVSAGQVHLVGLGTCVVDADQAGTFQYLAASRVQQSFQVVQRPDHFASAGLTVGTSTTVGASFSIVITAYDSAGNVATGFNGSASVNDQTGSLATTTAVFSHGVATVTDSVGLPSTSDWISVGAGIATPSQSHTFAVVGPIASFQSSGLTVGTAAAVGASFSIVITAYDSTGNVATGFRGTAVVSDQTGTLPITTATFSHGVSTVTDSVGVPSAIDWINVGDGVHSASQSHAFAVVGPVSSFASSGLTVGTSTTVRESFSIVIIAYDAAGNVATGFNGIAVVTDQTGTLPTTTATFSHGVSTVTDSVGVPSASDWISVGDGVHQSSQSHLFAVVGPVTRFASSGLTVGTLTIVGASFSIAITAYDSAGNVATGFNGTVPVSDQTGSFSATSATFTHGVATVTGSVGLPSSADWISAGAGFGAPSKSHIFTVSAVTGL